MKQWNLIITIKRNHGTTTKKIVFCAPTLLHAMIKAGHIQRNRYPNGQITDIELRN